MLMFLKRQYDVHFTLSMDLSAFADQLELAFVACLSRMTRRFSANQIKRLDIGVFPWHGTIELSFLLEGDICDPNDIAAWPNFDASGFNEQHWPEASHCCKEMQRAWEARTNSATTFFELVAEVTKRPMVANIIDRLSRSEDNLVTLFNPDQRDSVNYCA